jgi:hypothetical protein
MGKNNPSHYTEPFVGIIIAEAEFLCRCIAKAAISVTNLRVVVLEKRFLPNFFSKS